MLIRRLHESVIKVMSYDWTEHRSTYARTVSVINDYNVRRVFLLYSFYVLVKNRALSPSWWHIITLQRRCNPLQNSSLASIVFAHSIGWILPNIPQSDIHILKCFYQILRNAMSVWKILTISDCNLPQRKIFLRNKKQYF